jgi:hypothetical protein
VAKKRIDSALQLALLVMQMAAKSLSQSLFSNRRTQGAFKKGIQKRKGSIIVATRKLG